MFRRTTPFAFAGLLFAQVFFADAALADTRLFPDSEMVVKDRFSVEIVGRGPDLIFIPGLASSRETWKATAERLKGKYRLHLVQVAGFAGEPSRGNSKGEVLVPTAEAIDAYIVDNKLTPATLVGHSLGGTMSLYLAQKHPEHLKKIMIVDALPFYAVLMAGPAASAETMKPMADAMRANPTPMSDGDSKGIAAYMITSEAGRAMLSDWMKASDPSATVNALADDMTLDLRPGRDKTSTPVTLLYPYMDEGMHFDYARAYAPIPNKTIIRIENSRHFIMFDQPEKFNAALDEFLKN